MTSFRILRHDDVHGSQSFVIEALDISGASELAIASMEAEFDDFEVDHANPGTEWTSFAWNSESHSAAGVVFVVPA